EPAETLDASSVTGDSTCTGLCELCVICVYRRRDRARLRALYRAQATTPITCESPASEWPLRLQPFTHGCTEISLSTSMPCRTWISPATMRTASRLTS